MATVQELRATAKAYGLKGYSKLNKAQLEELISKYDQAAQEATHKQQAQQKIVGISYFGTPVTEEEYRAAMVPAFIKKGKAIYETIKAADSLQSVIDFLKPLYCYDSLRHCATLLGIDVTHIKHELPRVSDIYKKLIIAKAQELFPDPQEATPETPDTQAVSDPETTAPTITRFVVGEYYGTSENPYKIMKRDGICIYAAEKKGVWQPGMSEASILQNVVVENGVEIAKIDSFIMLDGRTTSRVTRPEIKADRLINVPEHQPENLPTYRFAVGDIITYTGNRNEFTPVIFTITDRTAKAVTFSRQDGTTFTVSIDIWENYTYDEHDNAYNQEATSFWDYAVNKETGDRVRDQMIILGKTLDTTTSNPDDDPDPTPPSNGGNSPEVSDPAPAEHQPAPTLVRFEIGRHYKEIGACDPDTYTFVGKCSRYYGIFVDSVHVYHRTKITNDGIAEHANARRVNGSPYGTGFLKADNEVCRHEIMSLVNGTSILLDANTVIHSYQELEAMLAPKSAPVQEVNTNSEATPDYDSAFDETAYSPDVQDVTVNIDDIPADHEPDIAPVSKPEREPWQKHICDHCDGTPAAWTHEQFIKGILLFYECNKLDHSHKFHMDPMIPNVFGINDYLKYSHSLVQLWKLARFFGLNIPKIDLTDKTHKTERKKHQIASIIAEEIGFMEHVYVCTYEDPGAPELPAELAEHIPEWRKETIARAQAMPVPVPIQEAKTETTANSELQPLSAEWDLLYAKFAGECTDIEIVRNKIRLANSCINLDTVRAYQEAHKKPATVSKSTPKPATRKPRHVKKLDDSRQLLISFDDAETPATIQPAKPKTRRASRPHVKKDYTRQLLIDFGEDIASGQTDHRQAA